MAGRNDIIFRKDAFKPFDLIFDFLIRAVGKKLLRVHASHKGNLPSEIILEIFRIHSGGQRLKRMQPVNARLD